MTVWTSSTSVFRISIETPTLRVEARGKAGQVRAYGTSEPRDIHRKEPALRPHPRVNGIKMARGKTT